MTIASRFQATQLIKATEATAWDCNPAWLNVLFSAGPGINRTVLGGSGLYAIFMDQRLLYVGTFAGPEGDLFGGSVLSLRWLRHIGTLTMRGKQISIRENAHRVLRRSGTGMPLVELVTAADLPDSALLKSQGMEMSRRKMEFAASHWVSFSGPINETLARIEFVYIRLDPQRRGDWSSKGDMLLLLETVETDLVARYEPPLNTLRNPTPRAAYAHVDAVMLELESRLRAAIRVTAPPTSLIAGSAPVTQPITVDEELVDLDDVFRRKLPNNAETFFDAFAVAITKAGRHLLYYTHGGQQARVAAPPSKAIRRPFLVLEWHQNGSYANCFKALARLPIDEVKAFGFNAKGATDQQMQCEFPFDPSSTRPETLLRLCDRSTELGL